MAEPIVTMIVPWYNQPEMLRKQLRSWNAYSYREQFAFDFVIVDDGSSVHIDDAIYDVWYKECTTLSDPGFIRCYRIDEDVPWNRGMARNLGTHVATTPWVLHLDTDHILPAESAAKLIERISALPMNAWYRFARYRVGKADFTRKKDKIADDCEFGKIHPHIDSYLCTREAYWRAGGYNQKFAGVLGGGSPFLKEMEKANGPPVVLDIPLHVYTSSEVPDSSVKALSRDPAAFKQRKKDLMAKYGTLKGTGFQSDLPWHQVF